MRSEALPCAVPFEDALAGVLVGDAALALDGVQEVDAVGRRGADRRRGVEQPLLVVGKRQPGEILGHARSAPPAAVVADFSKLDGVHRGSVA